jgi:hypothetical protein
LQPAAEVPGGGGGAETVFEYARTTASSTRATAAARCGAGFLVGTREGDVLGFRYARVRADGTTATGRCGSEIETLADGRLRGHETRAWESQPGEGTSVGEVII